MMYQNQNLSSILCPPCHPQPQPQPLSTSAWGPKATCPIGPMGLQMSMERRKMQERNAGEEHRRGDEYGRQSQEMQVQEKNTGLEEQASGWEQVGMRGVKGEFSIQRWNVACTLEYAGRHMCHSASAEWAPLPLPRCLIRSLSIFPSFLCLSFLLLSLRLFNSTVVHHAMATVRPSSLST